MHNTDVANELGLRGLRVLVVEDAPAVVNVLQSLFEDLGMVVVGPVSTPAAAERLLVEQAPGLALVDMHRGGHTGYALVEWMRQVEVPVVACRAPCRKPLGRYAAKAVQRTGVANNSPSNCCVPP
jgi:CheY-like chemotaxis protein